MFMFAMPSEFRGARVVCTPVVVGGWDDQRRLSGGGRSSPFFRVQVQDKHRRLLLASAPGPLCQHRPINGERYFDYFATWQPCSGFAFGASRIVLTHIF